MRGNFLVFFPPSCHIKIENSCILEAELWGIFEGLKLAWKSGFRKVMVESDSQLAVSLLIGDCPAHHPLSNIICDCKFLIGNDWSCSLQHIYRENNKVADFLANLGHSLRLGVTVLEDPPSQISGLLVDDSNGLTSARLVPVA